jgi:tetratricopeptide (TPR) repeat protein
VDTSGTITTVAGNANSLIKDPHGTGSDTGGFSGDGGPATSASLNRPWGVAVDGAGNLFIADQYNQRIRKVDASGTITTYAGKATRGFSGDGAPATEASLAMPSGVAVDGAGNLFIADQRNYRIRMVDASGTITTYAGNGMRDFRGDGGPATESSLDFPTGVAVDGAGNLFIADQYNHRIRKVDASGTITTYAGNGAGAYSGDGGPATSASLNLPAAVTLDAARNIFVADQANHRIRKVDGSGTITTYAGNGTGAYSGDGGPATSASLNLPSGVAVDEAGNLFIADKSNHRIRKVDPTGIITTVAGNGTRGFSGDGGPATEASFTIPSGVAVDRDGNLLIVDAGNRRIRKVDPSGIITTAAGNGTRGFSGDGGPATSASLGPIDVAVDGAGNLFIADISNRIRKVDPSGTIETVAGTGTGYDTGGFSGDGGPATSASFHFPASVVVDAAGNLFIADWGNERIRKVDASGTITTVAGPGTGGYSGDGGPATSASLASPTGVAVDATGNLFITDHERIRRVALKAALGEVDAERRSVQASAQAFLESGLTHYEKGEFDDAIPAYRKAIELQPNDAHAHYNLGVALLEKGEPREASSSFETAIRLQPDFAEAYNSFGLAEQELGQTEEAIAAYRKAVELRPDFVEAQNNLEAALREVDAERQSALASAQASLESGLAHYGRGELDEAIASYRRAIELYPKPEFFNLGVGFLQMNLAMSLAEGRYKVEAIEAYLEAIEGQGGSAEPALAAAHNNLGRAVLEKGEPMDAIDSFVSAIAYQPDLGSAYSNIGAALLDLAERRSWRADGYKAGAIAFYRKAIEHQPELAEAHAGLGQLLREAGQEEEAQRHLDEAGRLGYKPQ